MKRTRYSIPLAAASALIIGAAAPASAVVTVSGTTVNGDNTNENFSVLCSGGVLAATGTATTGDPCVAMQTLTVNPSGGTDTVSVAAVTAAAFPALIQVGIAADDFDPDTITGSPLKDNIFADSQDTVNSGEGSDRIEGAGVVNAGGGDDTLLEAGDGPHFGGAGDDRFVQMAAQNGIDGGDGVDSLEIDFDQLAVALGADSSFTATSTGILLNIPAIPTSLNIPATNIEQVFLTLFKGDAQVYDGAAFPGASYVRGMDGPDDLRGGGQEDHLWGGGGNDTVTGNGGSDSLSGGEGNDTIQARDGVSDRVDCGPGTDTVVADAADQVVNCESVQLPPVPPAPVPDTSKIKGPKSVTKPATAKFKFSSPTAGATFQCKVDKKKWKSCSSPYKVKTKKLDVGKHKLRVRAVLNGVVDPTPSTKKFKVKAG